MEHMGFLSLLPPLIAIVLAMVSKDVLFSLFCGIFLGVTIINGWNPIVALPAFFKDFIFEQAKGGYSSSVMVLVLVIGGMVALLTRSGGAAALAQKATRFINSKTKVTLAAWMSGIAIWFSDSANAMLVGPIFQPITDTLKISREKLAWIVDTTSAPVCMLVPISTFAVFAMGTIEKEFETYGGDLSVWSAFLQAVPFQFYCIGALLIVPLIGILGWDFGPMAKAEERTLKTGQPLWPDAQPLGVGEAVDLPEGKPAPVSLVVLPMMAIFVVFFAVMISHGFPSEKVSGTVIRTGLTSGYFLAGLICLALMVRYKIQPLKKSFDMFIGGMKGNLFLVLVLLLAWSLGSVCKTMGTAAYLIHLADGIIPAWGVAPLIFIMGALISLATGTSYGTFAIVMPVAIPMALQLGAPLIPCIAAVLSGGIFGDHCSPISDTTVLSSMGASCDHIDHVKTQLPYALMVGLVTLIAYFLSFWIRSALLLIGLVAVLLVSLVIVLGKVWGCKTSSEAGPLRSEAKGQKASRQA